MDVQQAIRERRSVRKYQDKSIEQDLLEQVMEAARLAPSARNDQNWKFVLVQDQKTRQLVAAASGYSFIGNAPVIIVGVSTDPERIMRCEVPAYAVDLAIAMTDITLAAVELGLGTCWIGNFDQQEVRNVLGIPDSCKVVQLMPLGYPADEPRKAQRKRLEEIICYDSFR